MDPRFTGSFRGPSVSLDRPFSNSSYDSLESMIKQSVESAYVEPNLSLVLDICEKINTMGKTAPRQAAFAIVKYVNRGSNSVANLALTLLDYCVKNCGYPFHLIISTKEFLNELVRKFPETPIHLTSSQYRVLELVQQWHSTLCVSSRYRNDFKHIGDMYRLLIYKGYRFPNLSEESKTGLISPPVLKTAEEQEKEDMQAYGVKLEELLRIGTPTALAQANDLMKIMAGYEKKIDYEKEFDQELDRVSQRATILNDMLNHQSGQDKFVEDGTLMELYGSVKSAQKKIQKMISENENEDKTERLLSMNDLINSVVNKYEEFKKGSLDVQSVIDLKRDGNVDMPSSTDSSPNKVGPINLIDFDDQDHSPSPYNKDTNQDLLGLMDFNAPQDSSLIDIGGLAGSSSFVLDEKIVIPKITSAKSSTISPNLVQVAAVPPKVNTFPAPSKPVADLLSDIDVLGNQEPLKKEKSIVRKEEAVIHDKNGLQIKLVMSLSNTEVQAKAIFMNITPVIFKDVKFMVSTPKSMGIKIEPLSGTELPAYNQGQICQSMVINKNSEDPFRLRFKVSYNLNGALVNESGEYSSA